MKYFSISVFLIALTMMFSGCGDSRGDMKFFDSGEASATEEIVLNNDGSTSEDITVEAYDEGSGSGALAAEIPAGTIMTDQNGTPITENVNISVKSSSKVMGSVPSSIPLGDNQKAASTDINVSMVSVSGKKVGGMSQPMTLVVKAPSLSDLNGYKLVGAGFYDKSVVPAQGVSLAPYYEDSVCNGMTYNLYIDPDSTPATVTIMNLGVDQLDDIATKCSLYTTYEAYVITGGSN